MKNTLKYFTHWRINNEREYKESFRMSMLNTFLSGCWGLGHDWIDKGKYLVCDECGKVKKL